MANFNYNKCLFAGRLTANPELKQTQSGVAYTAFSIAVKRRGKEQNASEPQTDFIDCEAWRAQAETICKYLKKGSAIWVDTSFKQEKFTDKDGNKRTRTRFRINDFQFIESLYESQKNGENHDAEQQPSDSFQSTGADPDIGFTVPSNPNFEEVDPDSDLPF